jgi:hypothetical protein
MRALNYLLIIISFILSSSKIIAGDFKGGLFAGFCASQMDGDKLAGYHKFGPTAGFFVTRMFNEKVGAQFELRYNQKGAASVKNEESYKARFNYIELPFVVSYLFTKKIKADAGLQPSVLIGAKILQNQFVINPKFDSFDLPYIVGLNYLIIKTIAVNVRFSYSIVPVSGFYNNAFNFVLYYYLK